MRLSKSRLGEGKGLSLTVELIIGVVVIVGVILGIVIWQIIEGNISLGWLSGQSQAKFCREKAGTIDTGYVDVDSDGMPDSCDPCLGAGSNDADSDNDGMPDSCEEESKKNTPEKPYCIYTTDKIGQCCTEDFANKHNVDKDSYKDKCKKA